MFVEKNYNKNNKLGKNKDIVVERAR